MDEVIQNLVATSSPDESIRAQASEFIENCTKDKNFYLQIFDILQRTDINPEIYILATGALRLWIKESFTSVSEEIQRQIIEFLQNLIINCHPAIEHIIERYKSVLQIFYLDISPFFLEILQFINTQTPLDYLSNLLTVYKLLGPRYCDSNCRNTDRSELVEFVLAPITPILQDMTLSQSPEGCTIYSRALEVFKTLYNSKNSEHVNFASQICIVNFNNFPDQVPDNEMFFEMYYQIVSFVPSLISNLIIGPKQENTEEILNTLYELCYAYMVKLAKTQAFPGDIFIPLANCLDWRNSVVPINVETVHMLISLCTLGEAEIFDFENNPHHYLSSYLSYKRKNNTDKTCRDAICFLANSLGSSNKNFLQFLLTEEPSEPTMYLVACQTNNALLHTLQSVLADFVQRSFETCQNNPVELATLLFLIKKSIEHIYEYPIYNSFLEFTINCLTNSQSDVVIDESIGVLYKLLINGEDIPVDLVEPILEFSEKYCSKNALKFFARYVKTNDDFGEEQLCKIIDFYLPIIEESILDAQDTTNLMMIVGKLVEIGGVSVITNDLSAFIEKYLNDPYISSVEPICSLIGVIFTLNNNEISSQLMKMLCQSLDSNVTMESLSYIVETICCLLIICPNAFQVLGVGELWFQTILSKFGKSNFQDANLAIILSLIIQSDETVDASPVLQLISSQNLFNQVKFLLLATLIDFRSLDISKEVLDQYLQYLGIEKITSYNQNYLHYVAMLVIISQHNEYAAALYPVALECLNQSYKDSESFLWPITRINVNELDQNAKTLAANS